MVNSVKSKWGKTCLSRGKGIGRYLYLPLILAGSSGSRSDSIPDDAVEDVLAFLLVAAVDEWPKKSLIDV